MKNFFKKQILLSLIALSASMHYSANLYTMDKPEKNALMCYFNHSYSTAKKYLTMLPDIVKNLSTMDKTKKTAWTYTSPIMDEPIMDEPKKTTHIKTAHIIEWRYSVDKEHQKIIDDIVVKHNIGKAGDYKGYVRNSGSAASINLDTKEIFINHKVYETYSEDEMQFILGHEIGHKIYRNNDYLQNDIPYIIKYCCEVCAIVTVGSTMGIIPAALIGIPSIIFACKDLIKSIKHEEEYACDEISVKTSNCHDGAISFFQKYDWITSHTHPSSKKRIERIKELQKEARS